MVRIQFTSLVQTYSPGGESRPRKVDRKTGQDFIVDFDQGSNETKRSKGKISIQSTNLGSSHPASNLGAPSSRFPVFP